MERSNFCFNLTKNSFTAMRSYINGVGDQTRLYYTKFTPIPRKLSQVCIVHGYSECSDNYLRMAEFLAKRGNVVHLLDLRGFGYSGGARVNEPIAHLFHDIETLLSNCCERELPTFIIAVGLGSTFMESLLQDNPHVPIAGFISVSPLLTFRQFHHSSLLQTILHQVMPWVFDNMLVHNLINPTAVCKNPLAVKAKIDSVFFESFITLHMANEYEQLCHKVRAHAYKFTYPLLLCYGLRDLIQSPKQVEAHFRRINSTDKQVVSFPDGYHDLHRDDEAEEMMGKIGKWIECRRSGHRRVKWRHFGKMEKGASLKWRYFWTRIGALVGLVLLLFKVVRWLRLSRK